MEKKNTEDKEGMIDFYLGYIYALIEVYAEIKDLPESEIIFDLLESVLKDFEVEVRRAVKERESSEEEDFEEIKKVN